MEFLFIPIGILVLILSYPFIRCFFKRLICAEKIRKIVRKKNLHAVPTHPFWYLGGKNGHSCDLYIETPHQIFAVKLFGTPRRRIVLVFVGFNQYFIRRFSVLFSRAACFVTESNGHAHELPEYNFRKGFKEEWEIKTPRPILLINPVPMEIRAQKGSGPEAIVGAGDVVNGMEIYSLSRLLADLENTL